jgi:hypothetical protein
MTKKHFAAWLSSLGNGACGITGRCCPLQLCDPSFPYPRSAGVPGWARRFADWADGFEESKPWDPALGPYGWGSIRASRALRFLRSGE